MNKSKKWSVRYEAEVNETDSMINTVALEFDEPVPVDRCIDIVYRSLRQMGYTNIYIGWYTAHD